MRKMILLIAVAFLLGCEGTIDANDSGYSGSVETIKIGLSSRSYEYAEVYAGSGELYKMYYTFNGSYVDTMWIDVPDEDTISVVLLEVARGDIEDMRIERFHPVADSAYRFRF